LSKADLQVSSLKPVGYVSQCLNAKLRVCFKQAMVFAFLGLLVLCTQPEPAHGDEHSIATTRVRHKAGFKRITRDTRGRHVETTSVTIMTDRTDTGNPKPVKTGFQEIFLTKRRGNASRLEDKVCRTTAETNTC
jgi:hypothetical protein